MSNTSSVDFSLCKNKFYTEKVKFFLIYFLVSLRTSCFSGQWLVFSGQFFIDKRPNTAY